MIIGFWKPENEYGYFSNWYRAEFDMDGIHFINTEQAFMYKKAILFKDTEIAGKILENGNPMICKKLGRMVKNFDSTIFDKEKFKMMVDVNLAKFKQNPDLKKKLLETGDATLVEASPMDRIWGIGMSVNNSDFKVEEKWRGQNLLGRALMEVRRELLKYGCDNNATITSMNIKL